MSSVCLSTNTEDLLVAAHAALSAVLVPLHREPAAVQLVIVVVNGIGEPEAPHGVTRRRIRYHAVARTSG